MTTLKKEKIKLYAKQLRLPTFNNYDEVIRQLPNDATYEDFLILIMNEELEERSSSGIQRRIKSAKFPVLKSIDEFDSSRLEHVSEAKLPLLHAVISLNQNKILL